MGVGIPMDLLTASQPTITLPSNRTISWDIATSFKECQEHTVKSEEHPGCLHLETDAWTSPNH